MRSFHAHNEHRKLEHTCLEIQAVGAACLVSDAGTPAISDPGYLLVRACVAEGIEVQCLPGPTAFVPALVQSGLPADRFHFEGFLPHKKGRTKRLTYLSELPNTFILYESPHRVGKCIQQIADHCGPDRRVAVCREITKLHEETIRGTAQEVADLLKDKKVKGEIVVVVAGKD